MTETQTTRERERERERESVTETGGGVVSSAAAHITLAMFLSNVKRILGERSSFPHSNRESEDGGANQETRYRNS